MSGFRDSLERLRRSLNYDALRDMVTIETFLSESRSRAADAFRRVGRPMRRALERWTDSDRRGARLMYNAAGIAMYVIAYLVIILVLYFGTGAAGGAGTDLPGFGSEDEGEK